MDGPGHYREAERLIEAARESTDHYYGEEGAIPTLLAALVHATLANTAATATGSSAEWMKAAGTKLSGGTWGAAKVSPIPAISGHELRFLLVIRWPGAFGDGASCPARKG